MDTDTYMAWPLLEGLKGVDPKVLLNAPQDNKPGSLTEEQLQTSMESALRARRVPILRYHGGDEQPDPEIGGLFVAIGVIRVVCEDNETDAILYNIMVQCELYQDVRLLRNEQRFTRARTWPAFPAPIQFMWPVDGVEGAIEDELGRQLDRFCDDYLRANHSQ